MLEYVGTDLRSAHEPWEIQPSFSHPSVSQATRSEAGKAPCYLLSLGCTDLPPQQPQVGAQWMVSVSSMEKLVMGLQLWHGTSCACLKMRKPRNCILQKGTWWWASKVYQILRHPYEYFTIFQHLSWPVLTMLSNWNVTPWCCIPRCFKYV